MIQFRLYLDKDREIEWLNHMAASGYAMKRFIAGFYTFEKCEPGEYTYQVDINEGLFKVSKDYKNFMEEMGIEIVALWGFWVILRKKTSEGEFCLYTDVESKIVNYTKIRNLFKVVTILEMLLFFVEVFGVARGVGAAWVGMLIIGVMMVSCARMAFKTNQMILELKNEDIMSEKKDGRRVSLLLFIGMLLNASILIIQDTLPELFVMILQIIAIILMLIGVYQMTHRLKK